MEAGLAALEGSAPLFGKNKNLPRKVWPVDRTNVNRLTMLFFFVDRDTDGEVLLHFSTKKASFECHGTSQC